MRVNGSFRDQFGKGSSDRLKNTRPKKKYEQVVIAERAVRMRDKGMEHS